MIMEILHSVTLIFAVLHAGINSMGVVSASDFYIAFPQNGGNFSKLNVYIASESETTLEIESLIPGISAAQIVPSSGLNLSLPVSLMLNGSKLESKGLRISSPKSINVAVTTESGCCGSEGYSALPLSHIGKEYLVTGLYNSSLTVIATESDTRVNISKRFSGKVVFNGSSYNYGDVISITLNRLQTLQLLVKGGYMIGSTISSDKPVGVVSGQYFGSLSLNSQSKLDFNQMMEYIPPMKNLGTIFIVTPIVNATYMRLIVFSAEKDTRFEIETEGFKKERIVRQYGSSVLTVSGSKPYVIRADNPVTLVQYPHGIKTFMMYIPNVDNYSNRMAFYTPNGYSSFVAIILKANDVDGLRIDGKALHSIMIYRTNTLVDNFSFYIVITMRVESGSHVISNVDKYAKFGLVTYGFNAFSSYGFPLSMN